jgi:hypothetical protein
VTDYEALKLLGHSPAKAKEIILDAKRGDEFSRRYLEALMALTKEPHKCVIRPTNQKETTCTK